jgi:hypothetical protein
MTTFDHQYVLAAMIGELDDVERLAGGIMGGDCREARPVPSIQSRHPPTLYGATFDRILAAR